MAQLQLEGLPVTNENGVKTYAVAAADLGSGGKPMWLPGSASPCDYLCLQASVAPVPTSLHGFRHSKLSVAVLHWNLTGFSESKLIVALVFFETKCL